MQTTIFTNEERLSTNEVIERFRQTLENDFTFEKSEIEELTDITAKHPADKFIVSEKPDVEVMQGDILIWSELTEEYKENFPKVQNVKPTESMVLQEDDSMTGDHMLIPLKGAHYTLQTGEFVPNIIKDAVYGRNAYKCKLLEIDSPFVIRHREHGNITLTEGKYMICSSMDSETLDRMRD